VASSRARTSTNPFLRDLERESTSSDNNPFRSPRSSKTVRHSRPERPVPDPTRRRSYSASSVPRPLDQIKRENKSAHRSHHLKKSSIPKADVIDRLGNVWGDNAFHHEGPFDATLASRQVPGYSPIEAVRESTMAALKATPKANIIDSLEHHYPLQGTAIVPPGTKINENEEMPWYEQYDIETRDGDYKRWPGMKYLDEDLKGKGEPSYTLEEFEKQQKAARKRHQTKGKDDYEMREWSKKDDSGISLRRPRAGSGSGLARSSGNAILARSNSSAGRMESSGLGSRLKKTFSIKRK